MKFYYLCVSINQGAKLLKIIYPCNMQRVHIIAIGNPAMEDLAIAIHRKNNTNVSGSDNEISEASALRLKKYDLLPDKTGWFPDRIDKRLNAVITGMDVTADNPELLRAKELGLKIYSYPEYFFIQTRSKTRIVVSGSYGKSTIAAMILHVLKKQRIDADYLTSTLVKGFENRVKLTYDARVAVFEGNESMTSPIDLQPKFHWYKPHIAIITGIAWNHVDIFPTPEIYVLQYSKFIELMEIQGRLIYFGGDANLEKMAENLRRDLVAFDYDTPAHEITDGVVYIKWRKQLFPVKIFGEHNLQNLNAARLACRQVGVYDEQFYAAISDFDGLENHLQVVYESKNTLIYRDIANSPAKLKASVKAIKNRFPSLPLVAVYELSTISSYNPDYLPLYVGCLTTAETALIYVRPENIPEDITAADFAMNVRKSFGGYNVSIFTSHDELQKKILNLENNRYIYLFNTSEKFPMQQYCVTVAERDK